MQAINKKIKLLTMLDVFSLYGMSLLSPIFAVFVIEKIAGGNLQIVGIALAIHLTVANILSLFTAKYFDKTDGDADEYKYLAIGYTVISLLPLLFIWVDSIWQIYILQVVSGIMAAISYPAWRGLYARSIDKGREAFEYSFNASANGLKAATAAILAGYLAENVGYDAVFVVAPIIGIPGIIALFKIKKYFITPDKLK